MKDCVLLGHWIPSVHSLRLTYWAFSLRTLSFHYIVHIFIFMKHHLKHISYRRDESSTIFYRHVSFFTCHIAAWDAGRILYLTERYPPISINMESSFQAETLGDMVKVSKSRYKWRHTIFFYIYIQYMDIRLRYYRWLVCKVQSLPVYTSLVIVKEVTPTCFTRV